MEHTNVLEKYISEGVEGMLTDVRFYWNIVRIPLFSHVLYEDGVVKDPIYEVLLNKVFHPFCKHTGISMKCMLKACVYMSLNARSPNEDPPRIDQGNTLIYYVNNSDAWTHLFQPHTKISSRKGKFLFLTERQYSIEYPKTDHEMIYVIFNFS